jgi:hypothetical protein
MGNSDQNREGFNTSLEKHLTSAFVCKKLVIMATSTLIPPTVSASTQVARYTEVTSKDPELALWAGRWASRL